MIKTTHLLLAGAVALGLSSAGRAQDASVLPPALPDAPAPADGDAMLRSLPQPPAQPASLYAPPPQRTTTPMIMNPPYLEQDPLLDLPGFPPTGWFAGAEIQLVKPHLVSRLSESVQNADQKANNTSTTVALGRHDF